MTNQIRGDHCGLAATLRQAVHNSGQLASKVAGEAGLPQSTVSRFMRGERDLTLGRAQLLADYLGLQLRPVRRTRKRN